MSGFEHPDNPSSSDDCHALLNAGFRIPLVGGSDKADNLGILGRRRTYARLEPGQEFTYKNWIEASARQPNLRHQWADVIFHR